MSATETETMQMPLAGNIRFYLAKKQMEGLFAQWLAQEQTTKLVFRLLSDVQKKDGAIVRFPRTSR